MTQVARKVKVYNPDENVLQAAKRRINEIIDSFDTIFVSFSGGKDSLAVLKLVEQVYEERGISQKINVIFRDEEVIPDDVIKFVDSFRASGKYNFRYCCLQLESEKYILGNKFPYIQWDKNRRHMRPIPDYAITSPEVLNQYNSDTIQTGNPKGKTIILTGIRADESLVRLNAICRKKNLPHIANTESNKNIFMGRVIYDWTERDIFKFFYDYNIQYCTIYDVQTFNGDQYRVSTPMHAESAKQLHKIKTLYPQFYNQLIDIFPEIRLQELYFREYCRKDIPDKYAHSWVGILNYIEENIEPEFRKLAKSRVLECMTTRANKQKKLSTGKGNGKIDKYGGYPILYVFKAIINGQYKRHIQPKMTVTQEEADYEK